MSMGALVFMGLTWAVVLALAGFCFGKVILGSPKDTREGSTAKKRSSHRTKS